MENLFSIKIHNNHHICEYHVVFENEKYSFQPISGNNNFPPFAFKRTHDEWQAEGEIDHDIKKQAINALEKYLLAQH